MNNCCKYRSNRVQLTGFRNDLTIGFGRSGIAIFASLHSPLWTWPAARGPFFSKSVVHHDREAPGNDENKIEPHVMPLKLRIVRQPDVGRPLHTAAHGERYSVLGIVGRRSALDLDERDPVSLDRD